MAMMSVSVRCESSSSLGSKEDWRAQRRPHQISGSRNDYRLYVDELFDAVGRELAAVTAFLHPAERQSGVRSYGIVDKDAAAFNHLGSDTLAPGQIARDDAATEPEDRVVGGGNRLRLVLHWNDSRVVQNGGGPTISQPYR